VPLETNVATCSRRASADAYSALLLCALAFNNALEPTIDKAAEAKRGVSCIINETPPLQASRFPHPNALHPAAPQPSMYINRSRANRALYTFDHVSNRWAAIPLRDPHAPIKQRPSLSRPADVHNVGRQSLSLTTWNIQASRPKPVERSELILDRIFKGPNFPDIVFLQKVVPEVRRSILSDSTVRSSFLTTDAEDNTTFKNIRFSTMTLLAKERFGSPLLIEKDGGEGEGEGDSKMMLDSVFCMGLSSRYGRDALCVNICHPAASGTILRLLNVHLDPLDTHFRRAVQMFLLDELLREPGCSGGIIAGVFNDIHCTDNTLVETFGLVDAWVALHGSTKGPDEGATWGVGVKLKSRLKPGRLGKVFMLGLQPDEIKVLQSGLIDVSTPRSNHYGLQCTFTV
jgi:tyrosyl-DNA phosphodiesterase 2